MDIVLIIIALIFCGLLIKNFYGRRKSPHNIDQTFPDTFRRLLEEQVVFYRELTDEKKIEFENRMQSFLSGVRITGIGTDVGDTDRILVAASAIIPIFGFHDWEYLNLHEVLLYPDSFNDTFNQQGPDRHTLGVVGSGPYQNVMILSQHELRNDFANKSGKDNTAIHEFVHLIDKSDGAVDGLPEFLISRKYVLPWLSMMQREIKQIVANRSDINPYGASDPAEFFAVASEYFFERPDLLEKKHPELYGLLAAIFRKEEQKI